MSARKVRLASGQVLAVQELGGQRAPGIILSHGGGQTRHAWARTARILAESGHHVIAYDHRGHGDSQRSADGDYRFVRFGEDLLELVRQLDPERAKPVIVGASLGGLSGLIAEMIQPGTFSAIVLVDIIPEMDADGVDRIQGFMAHRLDDGFGSLEEAAASVAAYLPNRTRPPSAEGLRKNLRLGTDGRWRWHWDPAFVRGANNINVEGRAMMQRLNDEASKIACPVRLIRGGSSDLVDIPRAEAFIRRLQDGAMVDVSDAGHMVAGDRNDIFADALLTILADLKIGGTAAI